VNHWQEITLADALDYVQPTNYIVESEQYDDSYDIPVLTPGASFLLGYTNETNGVYDNVPTIIFDDFTTAFKYVDFPFKVKSSAMKMLEVTSEDYDIRFLYYLMQTLNFDAKQHKRYWISKYSQQKVKVPALEEQKQIAAILDTADTLRQKDQQLVEHYTKLSQSLFLEMFGDPVTNPKGWELQHLKQLVTKIGSGATPRGGKEAYKTEGISLIRSLNVYDNNFLMKDLAFIDDIQADGLSNVKVENHDVLLNITGASVCRCTIVPDFILPARVNQHVAIIRAKKDLLNPCFFLNLIISIQFKRKLLALAGAGGATREALTKTQIEEIELPVPPIKTQNQFAKRVEMIEQQKKQAQANLEKSNDLFNALLQKAFAGELTSGKKAA
jgi:type I restriction enzyme S subunit